MAELRFSRRALRSLQEQDDYLRPLNPTAATAVLQEIERSCALLAELPLLGRAIAGMALRHLVTPHYHYRVIYRLEGNELRVLDILHPRQDARR